MDWESICHQNQAQISKDNIRENIKRTEHEYKVVDKVMLVYSTALKYENPYKDLF